MYSLFEPTTAAEIISRIEKLQSTSQAQWGKMNVSQMLAHCRGPMEVYFGDKKVKRQFIGLVFGKIAFKQLISDKPWRRSLPTAKEFKITGARNFDEEKNKLVHIVNRFLQKDIPLLLLHIHFLENYQLRNMRCLITAISITIFSNLACNGLVFVLIMHKQKL